MSGMKPEPTTNVSEIDDHRHLSVPKGTLRENPRQSFSLSIDSSTQTCVEEDENADEPPIFERHKTDVTNVKLSWLDCLKAIFFGPESLRRRLTAFVERTNPEVPNEKLFTEKRKCPFILTVSVYPCEASGSTTPLEGRCVLDTACLQGNIISAAFARDLGFTSFEPLSSKEQNGGIVATGSRHTVTGALYISWFHPTSVMVYRNMRFLVSETAPVDIVIGTHSIIRHQLISPPNLMAGDQHMLVRRSRDNPYREKLLDHEVETFNKMSEMDGNLKSAKGGPTANIEELEQEYHKAERKHEKKLEKVCLYDAIDLRDQLPLNFHVPTTGWLNQIAEELDMDPSASPEAFTIGLNDALQHYSNDLKTRIWREEVRAVLLWNHPRSNLHSLDEFMTKIPFELQKSLGGLFD